MSGPAFKLSVKAVIRDDAGRCLAIRRSSYSGHNAGKWDFPGGKVDPGEAFDAALRREVREETGLDVSVMRVAGASQSIAPGGVVAYLIVEAQVDGGDIRLSDEHSESIWVDPRELASMDLCPQFRVFAAGLSE